MWSEPKRHYPQLQNWKTSEKDFSFVAGDSAFWAQITLWWLTAFRDPLVNLLYRGTSWGLSIHAASRGPMAHEWLSYDENPSSHLCAGALFIQTCWLDESSVTVCWYFILFWNFFFLSLSCLFLFFDSTVRHVDLSSPARDQTCVPCIGSVEF